MHLHVVRRAGRRQRRHLLQLRPAQPRTVGLRAGAALARPATSASSRSSSARASSLYVLTLVASQRQHRHGRAVLACSRPNRWRLFLFGASGAVPVFGVGRWWTVLSAGVAARRRAAHPLQHDGAAPARAGRRGALRAGPHGHHLHGGLDRRLRAELVRRARTCRAFLFLRGSQITVGASASIAGLIGAILALRPPQRQQPWRRSYASSYIHDARRLWASSCPGIDNYAHAGGFAGGYLAAQAARSAASPSASTTSSSRSSASAASLLSIVWSGAHPGLPVLE